MKIFVITDANRLYVVRNARHPYKLDYLARNNCDSRLLSFPSQEKAERFLADNNSFIRFATGRIKRDYISRYGEASSKKFANNILVKSFLTVVEADVILKEEK